MHPFHPEATLRTPRYDPLHPLSPLQSSPNRGVKLFSHHLSHQFGDGKENQRKSLETAHEQLFLYCNIYHQKRTGGDFALKPKIFPLATKLLSPVSFSSILTASAFNRLFKWSITPLRRMTVSARFVIIAGNCEGVRIAKASEEVWTAEMTEPVEYCD